jgi:hypothetical protein
MALEGPFSTPNPRARICLWYPDGQTNKPAKMALVFADDPMERGILTLAVLVSPRHLEARTSVRHKDDPFLKKRPNYAKDYGVWDYLPTETVRQPKAKASIA